MLALSGNGFRIELYDLGNDVFKERLQTVAGVSEINVFGGQQREIQIDIDKSKLEGYGLAISQVVNRLKAENLNSPSGRIDQQDAEYNVRVLGEFRSVQEIEEIQIPTSSGYSVPLKAIAAVTDGYKEVRTHSRVNGQNAVGIQLYKQSDASMVAVGRAAYYGVSVQDVANTARAAINGENAGVYREGDKEVDIIARLAGSTSMDINNLENLLITSGGTTVTLGQVATLDYGSGPKSIRREGKQRVITVTAGVKDRPLGDVMGEIRKELAKLDMPMGYSIKYTGQDQRMRESFTELVAALLLSILLVFYWDHYVGWPSSKERYPLD